MNSYNNKLIFLFNVLLIVLVHAKEHSHYHGRILE